MKKNDNNINNVCNKTNLRNFFILTIFFYGCAAVFSNSIVGVYIAVSAAIILLCIYFIKIYKKEISEKEYMGYMGFSSVFSCVVCVVIASIVAMRVKFTVILSGIMILVMILMEVLMSFFTEKKDNKGAAIVTTIIGGPAAIAGMTMSRYMRANNIEIKYEYLIGMLAFIFAVLYCTLIKYRKLKRQENQSEQ